tara:strand:+ start:467 stop:706 length:240 start_codon:yes stop_codon:yes gene_type:complete
MASESIEYEDPSTRMDIIRAHEAEGKTLMHDRYTLKNIEGDFRPGSDNWVGGTLTFDTPTPKYSKDNPREPEDGDWSKM